MAEAFVNARGLPDLHAFSAGLERGRLNPVVVRAMSEIGIDISANQTTSVDDPNVRSRSYDFVVTVCDEASAEACPVYPSQGAREHWSFADPSAFIGTEASRLEQTRAVRDAIRRRVDEWLNNVPSIN